MSSTCPCLLLNLGKISGVADSAMVLFKLALKKLYFGLMNLMLTPRLGNVWTTIKNMRTTPFRFVVLFMLVVHMTCVGLLALANWITNSDKFCWFALCQFLSFVYVALLLWLNKSDPYFAEVLLQLNLKNFVYCFRILVIPTSSPHWHMLVKQDIYGSLLAISGCNWDVVLLLK